MFYGLGFIFLGVGLLAFIPVLLINYFIVKKRSDNKFHYLPTYILLSGLVLSFVLILIDLLVEDIYASSGLRGLRGFLAYSSFVVYFLDVTASFFSVRIYKSQLNK
jgi:hypothetical protein